MALIVYPAHVTGDRASGYVAHFADFPQLTAQAASQGELLTAARDVLHRKLEHLTADGVEWPDPSELSGLGPHPEGQASGTLLVDVDVEDAPVRVNISIGERLLKRIDSAAETRGMTRSGFIAAAARQSLGEGPFMQWDSRKIQDSFAEIGRTLNEKFGADSEFYKGVNELERKVTRSAESFANQLAATLRSKPGGSDYRQPDEPKAEPQEPSEDPTRRV